MNILYLVHDLSDAAVQRRRRFLADGGAMVALIGFRRGIADLATGSAGAVEIGRTEDGRLARRSVSTVIAALRRPSWESRLREADVIIARSLEMLLIAAAARGRLRSDTPIVYECLDIHRLMLGGGLVGRVLRRIERRLLARCSLLVVSSPRFVESYFAVTHRALPPWILLENKLLESELPRDGVDDFRLSLASGPPWRIGWFGIIRCARSLRLLAELVKASGGKVEVEIRGRPARGVIPDFDAIVDATPGLSFGGSYDRARDLPRLYGRVHYNWTIDFYEEGQNSQWLLPNRLYEGGVFGVVPLALRDVETGRWLERNGVGALLDAPLEMSLPRFFAALTAPEYEASRRAAGSIDRTAYLETPTTSAAFLARLRPSTPAGRC